MSVSDYVDKVDIRDVFQECYSTIRDLIENREPGKKLINAFCGMGKSSLIYKNILTCVEEKVDLNLVVFPSIALITQFNRDYISRVKGANLFTQLNVCSRNELNEKDFGNFDFTTDPTAIKFFLVGMTGANVVCCTYQSLQNFISCMPEGMKVDVVQFDEAHHTSSKLQKYCIFSEPFYNLGLFYTATPCVRIEHEIKHKRMERICFAPYWVGVEKGYLKNIEVRIDINKKPIRETNIGRNLKIYQSIARAILTTGNNKVMSFHRFVNGKSKKRSPGVTCVNGFYNPQLFRKAFYSIQRKEFPHLANKYKEIKMFKCTADDTKKINPEEKSERDKILEDFGNTPVNEVCLLASCGTIGEGVDTKNANMCVFADSKGSWMTIMQNIGRIVRNPSGCKNFVGTVLIPTLIDQEPYKECKDNVERDEYLREQLNKNQDYSMIMNVLSALKQSNEDDFDLCLFYPKNKKTTLPPSHTNTSGGTSTSSETDASTETKTETETSPETSGETSGETKTETDSSGETSLETSAETNSSGSSDSGGNNSPKPGIKIKMNKEFKVLWGIKDDQDEQFLENAITSAVIDCAIERNKSLDDKWEEKMQQVLEYKENTGGTPAVRDIENGGSFLSQQKINYKNFKNNLEGFKIPESRVARFEEYCKELEIDLVEYLKEENVRKSFEERKQECIEMMKKLKGKRPNKKSKDPKEKSIGQWICGQIKKLDKLKPEERKFIEQFKSQDKDDIWEERMKKVFKYKKKKGGIPKQNDKENGGDFLSKQKSSYKRFKNNLKGNKMPESRVARFEEYCKELEIDLDEKTEGKYKCVCGGLFVNNQRAMNYHNKTKKHIAYITKNKPEPKVENPSRESLIDQICSITKTNNSYTDWSVDELNSRLEALELEDW